MDRDFGKQADQAQQKEINKTYWPLIWKSISVILIIIILEGFILSKIPIFKWTDLLETIIGSVSLANVFYFPKWLYFINTLIGWIINAFILGLIVSYLLARKSK